MSNRNELVKKYFTKDFKDENELFESSMNYRLECYENNLTDDENIVKYLNFYELKNIIKLIKSNTQTDSYNVWLNKVFLNDRIKIDNKKYKDKTNFFNFSIFHIFNFSIFHIFNFSIFHIFNFLLFVLSILSLVLTFMINTTYFGVFIFSMLFLGMNIMMNNNH